MRTILVTGSDTGVGKTWVAAGLARAGAARGEAVELVKVVETGVEPGAAGDALRAAGDLPGVRARTLFSFRAALAPAAAAAQEGRTLVWEQVVAAARALPEGPSAGAPVWRIFEGAGGIASPLDAAGRDWADFAAELEVDLTIIVVPERLGAIHHARLTYGYATARGLKALVFLNRMAAVPEPVSASTAQALSELGVPVERLAPMALLFAASEGNSADLRPEHPPGRPEAARALSDAPAPGAAAFDSAAASVPPESENRRAGFAPEPSSPVPTVLHARLAAALAERDRLHQRRQLRVTSPCPPGTLNLSDNDYLDLAHEPVVGAAAARAAARYGSSASASPLITGWKDPHEALLHELCEWHGFPAGLLWTSGYAANSAVLGTLPEKGDLILADRLIHHSMIAGLSRSGARFKRYPHLDLGRLEAELGAEREASGTIWVVTESVFSMDGDYPDLRRLADLKRRYPFVLLLDEAHGLGWYGRSGEGLAAAHGVAGAVDVLVGTLGKALASGGAYTLFRDEVVRDTLINRAGEFIYSTAIPPGAAAAAQAAVQRIRSLIPDQGSWQSASREFRNRLAAAGWSTLPGDSPIVPVMLNAEADALSLASALRADGIWAAAVRPPTVPAGTSRLRFSLKRGFGIQAIDRVLAALQRWNAGLPAPPGSARPTAGAAPLRP